MNTTVTWAIAMLLEAPWSLRAWTLACRWWGSRTRRGLSWFWWCLRGRLFMTIHSPNIRQLGSEFVCFAHTCYCCDGLYLFVGMNETGEQSLLNLLVYEEELVTLEIVLLIQLCLSYPIFSQRRCSGDFRWHHLSSIALRKWNLVSSRQFMSSSTIIKSHQIIIIYIYI